MIPVGMPVSMSDGWHGRFLHDDGDIIVCIAAREVENDHLRGYRAFSRRRMTTKGGEITVDWRTTAEQRAARAAIVDELLRCSLLERSWADRPGG